MKSSADCRFYRELANFNFKLAPSEVGLTEARLNTAMSSTTDSPHKTFATLQNVINCPSSTAVTDLYSEMAATVSSPEADVENAATMVTVDPGVEAPYVPVIEDFVYFDPSASIK